MPAEDADVVGGCEELVEFLIGEEVEAAEALSLLLQVVRQAHLYLLQVADHECHLLSDVLAVAGIVYRNDLPKILQQLHPVPEHFSEESVLLRELLDHIGGVEDRVHLHELLLEELAVLKGFGDIDALL